MTDKLIRPEYAGSEFGVVEFGGYGGETLDVIPSYSILDIAQQVGIAMADTLLTLKQMVEYKESLLGTNLLVLLQRVDEILDQDLLILRQIVINDAGVE